MPTNVLRVNEDGSPWTESRQSVVTFAAAAAGDYADNDVIASSASVATPLVFTNAIRTTGGAGQIYGASLSCSVDALVPTSELFLFAASPTSESRDNVAFPGVLAADQPIALGSFAFPALADVGTFSFVKATAITLAAPLFVWSRTRDLYGILVLRDAVTNEVAGMSLVVTLYIKD